MTSWASVTLAEISAKPQYGAIARGTDRPSGPRFVRQTDIAGGRIDWSSVPYCDLDAAEFGKYSIRRGDLLISRLGNGVGNAATVQDPKGAVFAGYLVRFQPDSNVAVPEFVGYQLQSVAWREHVLAFRSGAAQPTLNAQQMGEFRFSLPPIEIQRSIAATLRALDDKIESNRRAMEVSEELADAIFSTWSSTAVPLAGVALLTMGNSPPGSSYNEEGFGMPFYQGVRDFGRRFPDRRVWTTEPLRRAEVNDTLVSVRAPVGDLNRASETCCIGRGVASVRSTTPSTIYYALRAASDLWEPFQHEGTVFGAINQADLATAKIPWPDDGSLAGVESDLAAIDAWIESLSRATSRLTSLRDMLLPALLSGSVPVTATGTEL